MALLRMTRRWLRTAVVLVALATAPSFAATEPKRMDDASAIGPPRAPETNWLEPQRTTGDRNTGVLALGIIVLGALLWWSRRQRERFEREDQRAERAARRASSPARPPAADRDSGDADADDLHAAARGTRTDADRQSPL